MLFNSIHIQQVHFAIEMWEKPRIDGKKKLKSTAVPTIFPHKENQNITIPTFNVSVTYKLVFYKICMCF